MSWTLSCEPAARPAVERIAAESTRELPLTTIDSGVEHAPGAVSWAYKGAALAATNASTYEANFRITQIYTNGFSRGPAPRRRRRVSSLDKGAGRELLLSSGPVSCGGIVLGF